MTAGSDNAKDYGVRSVASSMGLAPDTDLNALMARVADGDRAAFSPVFQQLWPRLLRFCTRALNHEGDAADAAQQAMEKIFTRASSYDRSRPVLPWALAMAAWECRTIRRRRVRRREAPDADATAGVSEARDAEHDLVRRQLTLAALEALGELSDTDRQTLLATFWEEAAGAEGSTLRKRRERALSRLRAAWKRLYGLD